ncbi:hypothetical protein KY495_13180 [Massilia sp. PAMC28688]|uniref:anti-sigma factor n=1 Tax=Massilia sp. PAMC28688 TaxID=2861283 RepID=UPI001C626E3C|nr:hypothetical protein [Massilia sp. PAMC28688]QYF91750.1 hypothetical protein KY495_13180 [Massilia sp. PAMC28688]
MSYSDETLMAFADGELDEATRREVEQAMRQDPALAAKVRQHQALRANVFGAYAGTLDEEVPQRLQAAARSSKVVHLNNVRPLRNAPPPAAPPADKRSWSWPEWGALAATLVMGVIAGGLGTQELGGAQQFASFDAKAGALTAEGRLDEALSQQLASAGTEADFVRLGVSFVSKEGSYCRSFTLPQTAGLACRSGNQWRIPVMATTVVAGAGAYRQASAMPSAVLDAIDERISGKALDANAEKVAQMQGWKR